MINIFIDNIQYIAEEGDSILDAALRNNIHIPNMCYRDKSTVNHSCMLCAVEVNDKIVLSCKEKIYPDIAIVTDSVKVWQSRKTALELLISAHQGDCYALCQRSCPVNIFIPEILRLFKNNQLELIKSLLNNKTELLNSCINCKAYCEKVCRRGKIDSPIRIKKIMLYLNKVLNIKKSYPENNSLNKKKDKPYSSVYKSEYNELIANISSGTNRVEIENIHDCLNCDCRKVSNCKLRKYADKYNAVNYKFRGIAKKIKFIDLGPAVIEINKCISCSICDNITEQFSIEYGITLINKGFYLEPAVPFRNNEDDKLQKNLHLYVESCPTGAISLKRAYE